MEFDLDVKSVSWVQWMHTHPERHGGDQFKDTFTVESSDIENLLYIKKQEVYNFQLSSKYVNLLYFTFIRLIPYQKL